jgi:RimJ/RimL family protein N-acetyltransferase
MSSEVKLIDVDEETLERMVAAAIRDAFADEVTAPVTPGNVWTQERVDWLRDLHRNDRAGVSGPTREATWAVILTESPYDVLGQVRLKALEEPDVYETGMWLTRTGRGRGLAKLALAAVADKAWDLGGKTLRAETVDSNLAAKGALQGVGFVLAEPDAEGGVRADLSLR